MGYDIEMLDEKGKMFTVEPFKEGGTQAVGGNTKTWISVTYNYAWFFYTIFDKRKGIRWLYGKKGKDCKAKLEKVIQILSIGCMGDGNSKTEDNYWIPTPQNIKKIFDVLLDWCNKFPEGVFKGD